MAKFDKDGGRVPTDLFEAAAWHYAIVATCQGCKHEATFDPYAIWWLFERKGWDNHFAAVARRLKCQRCTRRRAFVTWSKGKVSTVPLPMPDEREWKRAVSQFRS